MAIVEARGDEEQDFKVCISFERMMLKQVFERFVLIGMEVCGQFFQDNDNCGLCFCIRRNA